MMDSFPKAVSETPIHYLLTVKETAEYLRIPIPTVYYLVQRGKIPAIQIGGRWRIKKSPLDRDILHPDKQGQTTVLVVDDDPGLQDLFRTFLKKIGFGRLVVGTAKEAIKSLGKQKFDLMFLDLKLPDAPSSFEQPSRLIRTSKLLWSQVTRIVRSSIGFFKSVRSWF